MRSTAIASRASVGLFRRFGVSIGDVVSMIGSIAQCGLNRWLGEVAGFRPQSGLVKEFVDTALLFDRQRFDDRFARRLLRRDVRSAALVMPLTSSLVGASSPS